MSSGDDREGFAAFLLRARRHGLTGRDLISAIEATPRQKFVPGHWQKDAWSQRNVPIECGEVIEGIDFQARCIASLQLESSHRVLEIGTGSGYTAAVMSRLAGRVITVDRYKTLTANAAQRFEDLALTNVVVRHEDGRNGMPADGPFDRIVVWAAFDGLPRGFVDQLTSNGIMIAPIGPADEEQAVAKLSKIGSRFEREDIGRARLQPVVTGLAAAL